ncbi:aminopeptidase [Sporohalobacter salinus]|uniref:aminopeptidase n=1 Tax=Sporohalobacter salinus TaxID=1494606 RepID=UPI00195F899B|nr:aminopeptidase [Sporohalobacter salinus]MBM7622678.1 leucyl aminopeptidase (aminopeptidase T) [Sporohalobacter salinus]
MNELEEAAKTVIEDCMDISEEETVLIVTDDYLFEVGQVLFELAKTRAKEAVLTEITIRENDGEEPPAEVSELMQQFDVILLPTYKSLSHTQARQKANKAGARIASLPEVTMEVMEDTLTVNYHKIKDRSLKLAEKLEQAETAKVIAPNGTNIEMSINGRSGHPDTGIYHNSGDFGNLPAGEAYIAPVEGTATGKFVVDGSMSGAVVNTEEIELIVEDGYVVDIKGKEAASDLEKVVNQYGKKAKNIAELGIGTNDQAKLCGNITVDEKIMGTIHIAIGDNMAFGGKVEVDSHLDGIITNPTLELDGEIIMEEGNLKL